MLRLSLFHSLFHKLLDSFAQKLETPHFRLLSQIVEILSQNNVKTSRINVGFGPYKQNEFALCCSQLHLFCWFQVSSTASQLTPHGGGARHGLTEQSQWGLRNSMKRTTASIDDHVSIQPNTFEWRLDFHIKREQ